MSATTDSGLSTSPYLGLRPFQRDQTDIFFGRDEQVDELLAKLERCRFLGVIGASGSGKSSLVRAGLISALESGLMAAAGARWCVATMRPGNRPLANLSEALLDCGMLEESWSANDQSIAMLRSVMRRGPLGLIEVLMEQRSSKQTNLLLLVDQFEELFRYQSTGDRNEAAAFVELLLACAKQTEFPVYVVTTMRSDFLSDCVVFPGLPEALNEGQYLTPRMTREQCQAAVQGPAAIFGGKIEPRLVNRVLNDMGNDPDQLPLMQHALMRAWDAAVQEQAPAGEAAAAGDEPQILVRVEHYEAVGKLAEALSNHVDEVYLELSGEDRRIAELMFRCLSERQSGDRDTRRPVSVQAVAEVAGVPTERVQAVADAFRQTDRSFLMPPPGAPLADDTILDITHESLIRQWHRMTAWVEDEADSAVIYRRLRETARLWDAGTAGLWGTPDLENALAWRQRERPTATWAERYGGDFEIAMRFLDASVEAKEAQAREERKRRLIVLSGLLTALALISLAALFAGVQWSRAETAKQTTERAYDVFGGIVAAISDPDAIPATQKRSLDDALGKLEVFVEEHRTNAKDHQTDRLQIMLAEAYFFVGQLAEKEMSPEDAESYYKQSLGEYEKLLGIATSPAELLQSAEAASDNTVVLEGLAYTVNALGRVYSKMNQLDDAYRQFTVAETLRKQLVDDAKSERDKTEYNRQLASVLMNIGVIHRNQDKLSEAKTALASAWNTLGKSEEVNPQTVFLQAQIAHNLAKTLTDLEEDEEAKKQVNAALEKCDEILRDHPSVREYRYQKALSLWTRGDVRYNSGEPLEQVRKDYADAKTIIEALYREFPADRVVQEDLKKLETEIKELSD